MRQNRDQYNPKPRPNAFGSNERPFQSRPVRRPEPVPARPRSFKKPAVIPFKEPGSGKQRRRILKAAAWRLARLVHAKPASLMAMEPPALRDLIEQKCKRGQAYEWCPRGDALRLATKIIRLRR